MTRDKTLKPVTVVLRPVGRGNWRPLVLTFESYPRLQGALFRKHDEDLDLAQAGDVWQLAGRAWRVAEVRR